jgi:hypothetical protein
MPKENNVADIRFPDFWCEDRHLSYFLAFLVLMTFETLTTVSYGDAYPVHRIARSLATAEALIGQLYPAILIATLVGMALQARFDAAVKESEAKKLS